MVRETLNGKDEAFEELVRRHKVYVMKVVYRYARDAHEVDDLVQEVFVKAYFSLRTYRFKAPFQHWLSRVATHAALDHLRKRYRRKEDLFSEMAEDDSQEWLEGVLALASEQKNLDPVSKRDMEKFLERVLDQLPPKDQLVLKAMELEGKSVKEISEMTGWGESAVKVRLFRARKKMRKILNRLLEKEERFHGK